MFVDMYFKKTSAFCTESSSWTLRAISDQHWTSVKFMSRCDRERLRSWNAAVVKDCDHEMLRSWNVAIVKRCDSSRCDFSRPPVLALLALHNMRIDRKATSHALPILFLMLTSAPLPDKGAMRHQSLLGNRHWSSSSSDDDSRPSWIFCKDGKSSNSKTSQQRRRT